MENISSKKIIYQYGLYTGLVSVVWGVVQFSMGTHLENDIVSQIFGAAILIAGIVLGQLAYRKENGGFVTYNQCLKIGVGIGLILAIISLAYWFVLTNFADPDTNLKMMQIQYAEMASSNPEITSQFTEQEYIDNALPWLWVTYPAILLMILFFSLMFSLCTGIIIKRKAD